MIFFGKCYHQHYEQQDSDGGEVVQGGDEGAEPDWAGKNEEVFRNYKCTERSAWVPRIRKILQNK